MNPRLPLWIALALAFVARGGAVMQLGPWVPIFQGIEHALAQSAVAGPSNQVVHALRIDLHEPRVGFVTTPALSNAEPALGQTLGQTASGFLRNSGAQVAVNANFFFPCCADIENQALYVEGLAMSRGTVVSAPGNAFFAVSLLLTTSNVPSMVMSDGLVDLTGVSTAVTGNRPLLIHGTNVGEIGPVHPRTAIGYSEDKRYLFLLTVDGRQFGYSDGTTDYETALWMQRIGAFDALNLDGGGSTTMVVSDGRGGSLQLNRPIHGGVPGRERFCANHFGVCAPPLETVPAPGDDGGAGLRIAAARLDCGFRRLSVSGDPRRLYRLEYCDYLNFGIWSTLTTAPADELGGLQFLDAALVPQRFYRVAKP